MSENRNDEERKPRRRHIFRKYVLRILLSIVGFIVLIYGLLIIFPDLK